ncbi:MAG: FkbM family methyltransferase [Bradyrhizobiaceae bacterium]|nr:MAG: FkbM family methyltransferase [Bradyrhizobiaceae bacterium]
MTPRLPETGHLCPTGALTFDRITGALTGSTGREALLVQALRAGARISSNWSYRGFAAGCRLLRPFAPDRTIQIRLTPDATFSFPFADGYWSLLLDPHYSYERDINLFFRSVADADYTLVDCGANFGYWSTLVTSQLYGSHASIAIEPSSRNFAILSANARLNGGRFQPLHYAIGAEAGTARLSGSKHEAMSIADSISGNSGDGEDVAVIPLDSLIGTSLNPNHRHVIKLDVEGVEIAALRGGTKLLETDCVLICEDHGNDRNHTISRHILEQTQLKLFCFDPLSRRFEHLENLSALDRIKTSTNWGYNILATRSPYWQERIEAIDADKIRDSGGRPLI